MVPGASSNGTVKFFSRIYLKAFVRYSSLFMVVGLDQRYKVKTTFINFLAFTNYIDLQNVCACTRKEKKKMNEIISNLPNKSGVYFFYDENDNLIYVGKSVNIKKRVLQHFSGKDRKSIKIQTFTKRIEYELTGSELIALLHESELIKKHQPIYNRAQRKSIFQYGLYVDVFDGYKCLSIEKINENKKEITSFTTLKEAKDVLFRITEKYQLCQKINGLYKTNSSCFQYQIKSCLGACISKENLEHYNKRVDLFLSKNVIKKFSKFIELEGRNENEKGIVYIQNGVYKGFGYFNKSQKSNFEIENKLDTKDARRILIRYLINNKI